MDKVKYISSPLRNKNEKSFAIDIKQELLESFGCFTQDIEILHRSININDQSAIKMIDNYNKYKQIWDNIIILKKKMDLLKKELKDKETKKNLQELNEILKSDDFDNLKITSAISLIFKNINDIGEILENTKKIYNDLFNPIWFLAEFMPNSFDFFSAHHKNKDYSQYIEYNQSYILNIINNKQIIKSQIYSLNEFNKIGNIIKFFDDKLNLSKNLINYKNIKKFINK